MKVFLGGTTNDSDWRERLIPMLEIEYFNPVVPDWTPECQAEEERQREVCDLCLYVITPRMAGFFSIAEAVDDSNKRPAKTMFCMLEKDGELAFTPEQLYSLQAVVAMIRRNGGRTFDCLEDCAEALNIADVMAALRKLETP